MEDLYGKPTVFLSVLLLCTTTRATILYDTTSHTVVPKVDIDPEQFVLFSSPYGIKMFGTLFYSSNLDKQGGLETATPTTPTISILTWMDSELNYVNHPTAVLYKQLIANDDNGELTTATNDVTAAFGSGFTAALMAVVTYSGYTADGTSNPPTNTFQLALITDGTDTYMELNYPVGDMGWWADSSGNYPKIKVTYDGTDVIELPGSGTLDVETYIPQGNVPGTGYEGRWIYKIDGTCATCTIAAGGYVKECAGGDQAKCVCSSCDAGPLAQPSNPGTTEEPLVDNEATNSGLTEKPLVDNEATNSGLTEKEKNIIIASTTVGGAALLGMTGGLIYYFKKKKDQEQ